MTAPEAREIIGDVLYALADRATAEGMADEIIEALASHGWLMVRLAEGFKAECSRRRTP